MLRILLVEDHEDTSVILGRILRKMGYHVVQASTIAEALRTRQLRRNCATAASIW